MTNLNIEISMELNQTLVMIAEKLHEQESDIVVKALKLYLQELLEDIEDADIALEVMADKNQKLYTPEEVRTYIKANCHD